MKFDQVIEMFDNLFDPEEKYDFETDERVEHRYRDDTYRVLGVVNRPKWWKMAYRNGSDIEYLVENSSENRTFYADHLEPVEEVTAN